MNDNLRQQLSRLPEYFGAHVTLVGLALLLGVALSLPLGVWSARSQRLSLPLLSAASVMQTIPSLALLALMVPLLGSFGFFPALVALVLYSMLPVLRNTVTGLNTLEPSVLEAAVAVGMTPSQVLRKVELPLALPTIVAGVRTAAVWVVGVATLSTPVGQTSLGNYIFGGLQTRNWASVLVGCLASAFLALLLDGLLALMERGLARRQMLTCVGSGVSMLLVFGLGVAAPSLSTTSQRPTADVSMQRSTSARETSPRVNDDTRGPTRPIRVGAKTFTEQYILSALIQLRLERAGLATESVESLGSTVAFDALRSGRIDVYVDYTGTLYANGMQRGESLPPWQVSALTAAWLAEQHAIRQLGSLGFENAYALAMRRDRAEELGVVDVAALSSRAPRLKLGSDYEFFERPEWPRLRERYSLEFAQLVSFDSSFMYGAVQQGEVDVITAFSSDGRIAAFDLVVLRDPRGAFLPYDAVVLLGPAVSDEAQVEAALLPLLGAISADLMREANWQVDRDEQKLTPLASARWLDQAIEMATNEATSQ